MLFKIQCKSSVFDGEKIPVYGVRKEKEETFFLIYNRAPGLMQGWLWVFADNYMPVEPEEEMD